ncbi:MAG: hypothetical protein RIS64_4387 [Bacteroidota bacterium]|jgi:hypothetical protein
MKKNYRILLLAMAVLGVTLQCKKKCTDQTNPECDNYDPCWNQKPTRAYFKILESGDDIIAPKYAFAYETDTIIGGYATFLAEDQGTNVEYQWKIGRETYSGQQVTLDFGPVPNSTTIPIKLLVKNKKVDHGCFPMDSGVDSFVKNMYVHNRCLVKPTGLDTFIYRGHHLDAPHEVQDVTLYYNTTGTAIIWGNLIRERNIVKTDQQSSHYRLSCFMVSSHMSLEGSAFLHKNDSITIKYEYSFLAMEPKQTLKRVFVGKKIK